MFDFVLFIVFIILLVLITFAIYAAGRNRNADTLFWSLGMGTVLAGLLCMLIVTVSLIGTSNERFACDYLIPVLFAIVVLAALAVWLCSDLLRQPPDYRSDVGIEG